MSVADELRKLADLKKEGLLTEEEFERQKAALLDDERTDEHLEAPSANRGAGVTRLIVGAVVAFGLLLLIGRCSFGVDEEQLNRELAIEHCWKEYERKSLTPSEKIFAAKTCEFMESEFEKKYGRKP